MDLKECRKRREQLNELVEQGVPANVLDEATCDYFFAVLKEIYAATSKNGAGWTNQLAGIAVNEIE
jgi:hypothetical protein